MIIVKGEDIAQELMNMVKTEIPYAYNSVPNTLPDTTSPFVVCGVYSAIVNMGAYFRTTSSIDLYVPNLQNGTHNSKKIDINEDLISSLFPIKSDNYMFDMMPTVIPLGNDSKGYCVNRIQIETIIYNI